MSLQQWRLRDRDLFQVWGSHVEVVPFVFSCSLNLVPPCFQIACRIYFAKPWVQGEDEFEATLLAQRQKLRNQWEKTLFSHSSCLKITEAQ